MPQTSAGHLPYPLVGGRPAQSTHMATPAAPHRGFTHVLSPNPALPSLPHAPHHRAGLCSAERYGEIQTEEAVGSASSHLEHTIMQSASMFNVRRASSSAPTLHSLPSPTHHAAGDGIKTLPPAPEALALEIPSAASLYSQKAGPALHLKTCARKWQRGVHF